MPDNKESFETLEDGTGSAFALMRALPGLSPTGNGSLSLSFKDLSGNMILPFVDSFGNIQDSANGPVSPGTAAVKSALVGGQYNSSLPTAATGQQMALQIDKNGRLLVSSQIISTAPYVTYQNQQSINTNATYFTQFSASANIGIKEFYAGGTGIGKQTLYLYVPANSVILPGGNFDSISDVAQWSWVTNGGTGSIAYSTVQKYSGTGSCALTFTNSDSTKLQGVKYTYSTPADYSIYRYVSAQFYNTVSTGGAYTRTIAIILTDSNAITRTYSVAGLSTASPFNAAGWINILGDIENPTSSSATTFDSTLIASVELRMFDSANKSGTVYWDVIQLTGSLSSVFPIYHQQNTSFNIAIDPAAVVNSGQQILLAQKNNDTARKEYFALINAVAI